MSVELEQDISYQELSEKMLGGYAAHPPIPALMRILCREINDLRAQVAAHAEKAQRTRKQIHSG